MRTNMELKVCTLFLLSALVCSGTVAIEERREELQTAVTFGVSGVKCTRDGRRCVTGARCVNRKCQCPSGKKGNAELDCVEQREQLCYISGKANIIAFGGSDATLNFPCSYRATRFVIPARTSSSGPTSCSVEVMATNELHIDSYRVSRLRVSVGLVQPALQMQSNQEVTADGVYGIQTNQTKKQYTYHVNVGPIKTNAWGSSNLQTARIGDLISFNVDSVNNFVVLNIPTCGARIKFRAYDVTSDFQEQVPGIAIMAPSEANFIQSDGSHLSALCGRSTDNAALYKNHASYLGLPNPSVATLYDILEDGTLQTDNPAASRCERAVRLFAASRDKKVDVRECSFLVLNTWWTVSYQKISPFKKTKQPCDIWSIESRAQLFGACKSLPNGCLQCMPEFSPAANQLALVLPDEAGCKRLSKWLERTQNLSVLIFKIFT